MRKVITISTCTLNQWVLDFEGNLSRILCSIQQSVAAGASLRVGPELEICGYDCEDHFYESDTFLHSWQVLRELLTHESCRNILCDVGMPVLHRGVAYNCRVLFYNKRILLIRPKLWLADNGNYRESRWFKSWKFPKSVESHTLPDFIQQIDGQQEVPFGDAVLESIDGVKISWEICEELWNASCSHVNASLDGVHIICNSSGSHHELRKTGVRDDLIHSGSRKCGGVYVFSNLRGCDGERMYFDGCSQIVLNGQPVARGKQFALEEVEVISATVDLVDVETFRLSNVSSCEAASSRPPYPVVRLNASMLNNSRILDARITLPLSCDSSILSSVYHRAEEEMALGPALWLWDFLRRSGLRGFFIPLSGGLDSTSVVCIVYSLCRLLFKHVDSKQIGNAERAARVLRDLRLVLRDDSFLPQSAREICGRLLTTCYMGTQNSSTETRGRAAALANAVGSRHFDVDIDPLVSAATQMYESAIRSTHTDESVAQHGLRFQARGGSQNEDLALQNVQARSRMLTAYLFSQLLPFAGTSETTGGKRGGLLVLAASNVDECLLGYLTKYDCSSADLNPIGSICKADLRLFVSWCATEFASDFQLNGESQLSEAIRNVLKRIGDAPPTAELCPLSENGQVVQTDEQDMGLTYDELNVIGRLRKQLFCGPYSLMLKLSSFWTTQQSPSNLNAGADILQKAADKVKRFFTAHARNRHKSTVLTPSYHTESYSPDDNRFDLRPFLYNTKWSWQFRNIDEFVAQHVNAGH